MAIGADFSGAIHRTLQWDGQRVLCRSIAAAYCDIELNAANRALIDRARIPHAVCDDGLLLYGTEALRYGATFGRRLRPLMAHGCVPRTDVVARQLLAVITEAILPPARRNAEICAYCSTSAFGIEDAPPELQLEDESPATADANDRFFARILQLHGYAPVRLSVPQAALLAVGANIAFTGVAVTCRPDRLELSVCQLARELQHVAVTPVARSDDGRLRTSATGQAQREAPHAAATASALRSRSGPGPRPRDDRGQLLRRQSPDPDANDEESSGGIHTPDALIDPATLREMHGTDTSSLLDALDALIAAAADRIRLTRLPGLLREPLPIVLHGFPVARDIAQDRLEALLKEFEWPLECDCLIFDDDPHTVARGALIAATLEEDAREHETAAA